MRRSWLFYGDSASSGAKVWVWDHVKEVALDREAKEVLEARRGGATRVPPLLSLVEELAAKGESVVVVGWSFGRLPAAWLLETLKERKAVSELDVSEWMKSCLKGRCA